MSILQDIRPVSYLKSRSADILKQVNDTHRPIIITQNGEPKAVLQDPESYENMRNTIGLLKLLSLAEEDVRQGKTVAQNQVFQNIEKLLDLK
ncbi:MAG: type II toxin-antitoxin system Phd/YefM family antitoxin [Methylobacter sp.]|nr:type II toxin-antitoxin system Phd/YefM family antitoxin [Methylobacter sp.]